MNGTRKRIRYYTEGKILAYLGSLSLILLGLSAYISPPGSSGGLHIWIAGIFSNLGSGIVGSCVTFFLIDLRLNRKRAEEARLEAAHIRAAEEARDDERRRFALIAMLRSRSVDDARSALEELRLRGWLSNGSLRGVDLSGANLRGLDLSRAHLADAMFRGADLRNADFSGADLRNCNFEMADLRGWRVSQAILDGADFTSASQ